MYLLDLSVPHPIGQVFLTQRARTSSSKDQDIISSLHLIRRTDEEVGTEIQPDVDVDIRGGAWPARIYSRSNPRPAATLFLFND